MKPAFKFPYGGMGVKLFLYVSVASFSSLLSDLSHYTCSHDHISDISLIRWATIILNFIVQGLIAWRAFIDGTVEREEIKEKQEMKLENIERTLH